MKKQTNTFRNNFYLLRIIWNNSPSIVILSMLSGLIDYGIWVFYSVIFMKYLFGTTEINRSFQEAATFIGISLILMLFAAAFDSWYQTRFLHLSKQKLHFYLNNLLFQKASNVDIACYENPEFYDNYTKATTEVYERAMSVISSTATLISSFLASVFVVYTMFSINIVAGFFAFMPLAGNFIFGKIRNQINYKKNMETIPLKRRQEYVNRTVYLQKFAKELRLGNIYDVLKQTYQDSYNGLIETITRYQKKIFFLSSSESILCFPLVFEGLWFFAAFCAMVTKSILIGDFVVLASAIVSTTWMLRGFTDSLMACYENGLYIANLRSFFDYKPAIPEDHPGQKPPSIIETLEFKNVSFAYEGSNKNSLKQINLLLQAGEKTALVGHNGAGKSTLIKLILRFYDPTDGEILLNGINIKNFELCTYRELIGAVFQDFQLLSLSVAENVLMERITEEEKRSLAIEAMKKSGVYDYIMTLPKKEDTILTREFDDDGVVLSGGQFQKIAVARAFAKNTPIVLLDEPSSALDPVAEYQMYETIMELGSSIVNGQKRISVIISHRLSSASMADKIILLANGEIAEEGTHKELMQKQGNYADMFIKQAENYLQPVG